MPELRSKIPKRIGVTLSYESVWEVVFSFYQVEHHGYLRMAIALDDGISRAPDSVKTSVFKNLSGINVEKASDIKTGSLRALVISVGESEFDSLCDFSSKNEAYAVDHVFRAFVREVYRRGLPIGSFGRAVPLVVKSIQGIARAGPMVTVGNNPKLQAGIEAAGAQAITTRPTEVIIDHANKLVTSGGQLASNRLVEVAADCENMFEAIIELSKG